MRLRGAGRAGGFELTTERHQATFHQWSLQTWADGTFGKASGVGALWNRVGPPTPESGELWRHDHIVAVPLLNLGCGPLDEPAVPLLGVSVG